MTPLVARLSEQAGLCRFSAGHTEADDKCVQQLVELVVKECVECAEWVGRMNSSTVSPASTSHAIKIRINKHFGVTDDRSTSTK